MKSQSQYQQLKVEVKFITHIHINIGQNFIRLQKMLLNRSPIFIIQKLFKSIAQMSYLHIAEKNSIAKQVSNILSDGTKRTGFTRSQYNPVYEFTIDDKQQRFSSVRGHMFEYQLPQECKSWANYDNKRILTRNVGIVKKLGPDMESLFKNLEELAKKSKHLILWLDCDRQGEAIAYEVIEVCLKSNPKLTIQRARFSAVTRQDILQAYHNLVLPNEKEANAVKYRMQIDFRLGCTFTRFQTLVFRQRFQSKENNVLSYGPCQLPTLGFVVERYLQIKYFKPQDYYFLKAVCVLNQNTGIDLKWTKKNTRNQVAIALIYKNMYDRMNGELKGKVLKRSKNVKKRYRPYPLTTVELQKLATDKLRMSSARVMDIAQKLYTRGFISYPRTQTNSFPKTFNLKSLVDRLRPNDQYHNYVEKLIDNNQFENPKIGNSDDQAHSPIHPVKNIQKDSLTTEEWKIYDLISRHFLACCSKDAVGDEFEILADIGGQEFKATYLTIREKNFLQIYPFVKWANSTLAGEVPEEFDAIVQIGEEKTKPPSYLSESNLIEAMEKNNIGTDSTIHEHIETIQKRKYAVKNNNTFKPTSLGASLIIAYRNLGMRIAQCDVRRMMEQNMERIAQGQMTQDDAIHQTLNFMMPIYEELTRKKATWLEEITKAMQEHNNLTSILEVETHQPNENSNSNPPSPANNPPGTVICYRCKEPGHFATQCPASGQQQGQSRTKSSQPTSSRQNAPSKNTPNTTSSNNYMSEVVCYRCNEKGHFAPNCPNIGQNGKVKKDNEKTKSEEKSSFKSWNNQQKNQNQGGYRKNNFSQDSSNQEQKKQRKTRACAECGVEGRHPKDSTCQKLKKNKNQVDFL